MDAHNARSFLEIHVCQSKPLERVVDVGSPVHRGVEVVVDDAVERVFFLFVMILFFARARTRRITAVGSALESNRDCDCVQCVHCLQHRLSVVCRGGHLLLDDVDAEESSIRVPRFCAKLRCVALRCVVARGALV